MSVLSKLAGHTLLYGLGSVIPRALNFMLFPLHTRVFHPEDYGIVSYLYIIAAFLNVVCSFGMETAYFRYATKGLYREQQIFNIAQTTIVGISMVVAVLLYLFADPIANHIELAGKSHYILWLAAIIFIDAAVVIPFARLRLNKKPLTFALARITHIVVLIGLNLFFFIGLPWWRTGKVILDAPSQAIAPGHEGIAYVFLANLIANAVYFLFFIKTFMRWRPTWNGEVLASMARYSYPIMITGVAGIVNEMFSRWALEWWLPDNFYPKKSALYAVGLLSVAYKYAVIMGLAIQAFRLAAEPFFFSNARHKNSPALFARVNHFFVIFMSFTLLAIVTNLDVLKLMAGSEVYYEGLVVVPILLCGYLLLGVYYNFSIWFKLADKTYYGTAIALGGMVVTVLLNLVLIPHWGYIGSSWASLGCYFCMTVACYITGQKNFPVPYKILPALGYVVFALGLIALSSKVTFTSQWMATTFHLALLVFYMLVVYLIERKKMAHVS